MRNVRGAPSLLLVVVLLLGAIAFPLLASAEHAKVSSGSIVKVAYNKKLHKSILVNGLGLTLYMYVADVSGHATCVNDLTYHCSKAWHPLRTIGAPRAGAGAKASLLGTVKRSDGGVQVTYNRHPLYTDAGASSFALVGDKKPGQVNGQGFADLWWVLSAKGTRITRLQ